MLPLIEGKRENNAIQYLYLMCLVFLYMQKKYLVTNKLKVKKWLPFGKWELGR